MTFQLIGDGLAGTMLAVHLHRAGIEFVGYGDGQTNTPPLAFLHLFQGRTFHREPTEMVAFERALEFWRREPLAQEWPVWRWIQAGDRLHRSVQTESIPEEYKPEFLNQDHHLLLYQYAPGFTIEAGQFLTRERQRVSNFFQPIRVEKSALSGPVILACGLAISEFLPDLKWDVNPGRTVRATCSKRPRALCLKEGCHLGGHPDGRTLTLGGRVSSKGEAKNDEALIAESILKDSVTFESEWWGQRIANALDRRPLVGWVDSDTFVFAGFGGRGLFWLPYLVTLAANALQSGNNDLIPKPLRADRFGTYTLTREG